MKSDLTLLDSSTTGSKLDPGGGSTHGLWGGEQKPCRGGGIQAGSGRISRSPQDHREESFQAWGRACAWSSLELGRG